LLILLPLSPLLHENVKGGNPELELAVAVPSPELQISGVEVAETELLTPVIHVVSPDTDPIPTPHAVPVRKYPVVPADAEAIFNTPLLYGNV